MGFIIIVTNVLMCRNACIRESQLSVVTLMKNRLLSLLLTVLAFPALSQATSPDLSNVLVMYDFNQPGYGCCGGPPSYLACCISASNFTPNRIEQCWFPSGAADGSAFRSFSGWDSAYDYSFARTDFSPAPGTLSYDVFVSNDAIANISGISFDWMRPDSSSVNAIQATIFWQGAGGTYEYLSTGPVGDNSTGIWDSCVLNFPVDVTPLPTGIDTSGKQFHIELYAWGANGGPLYLDNVALVGNNICAPIPEPGGAVLIAAAGVLLLLRRRSRTSA